MQEIDALLTVNAVKDVPFFYPFCVICLRKIQPHKNRRWNCAHCGIWQRESQVQHRYRMVFNVTDCHKLADVTVFGKSLEVMFGITANEFNKYITELESLLLDTEVSVKQVLLHAVKQVFCGYVFCFTFNVPMNQPKSSQTEVNLNWLGTKISGGLIAKRISFAANNWDEHPTVKEAVEFFCEKLGLMDRIPDKQLCSFESSYFFNVDKESNAGKDVHAKPLHSNMLYESLEFCSPGLGNLDFNLSEFELTMDQTGNCSALDVDCNAIPNEEFLKVPLCLPWKDSDSILISSTPLPVAITSEVLVVSSPHSMQTNLKCFNYNYYGVISAKLGKSFAKLDDVIECRKNSKKKCFKKLLPFYQADDDTNQSHCIKSSPSTNCSKEKAIICKTAPRCIMFDESIGNSLLLDQIEVCDFTSDSAFSPDIFK